MNKLLIGIDGGATKTLGALFDVASGNILKQHVSGYCNFGVDEVVSKQNIESTIDSLLEGLSQSSSVEIIFIGAAGYSKLNNREAYVARLRQIYGIEVLLVTDADLALASIQRNQTMPTILVLGGTGSIVLAKKDDLLIRVGGTGHLLGDEGSAYHVAISALKSVIHEFETSTPRTSFSKQLLQSIHISTIEDLIHFVYSKNKQEIADLAKVISSLAESGYQEAIDLLKSEGMELAIQTIKAYKLLETSSKVLIGFQGGFLRNAPFVKETLIASLNESLINYQQSEDHPLPIIGAYYLGLTRISER